MSCRLFGPNKLRSSHCEIAIEMSTSYRKIDDSWMCVRVYIFAIRTYSMQLAICEEARQRYTVLIGYVIFWRLPADNEIQTHTDTSALTAKYVKFNGDNTNGSSVAFICRWNRNSICGYVYSLQTNKQTYQNILSELIDNIRKSKQKKTCGMDIVSVVAVINVKVLFNWILWNDIIRYSLIMK